MEVTSLEEIGKGLFRIGVVLKGTPLGSVNTYIVLSGEELLFVDPGLYEQECVDSQLSLLSLLRQICADIENIDVLVTHFHIDQIGQAYALYGRSVHIFFESHRSQAASKRLRRAMGTPEEDHVVLCVSQRGNGANGRTPSHAASPRVPLSFTIIEGGQLLKRGDLSPLALSTPGHSPGHCCLYELKKGLLLSGDHILEAITPDVGFWPELEDPLANYPQSLLKIRHLKIELTPPGHSRPLSKHKATLRELLLHHQRSCEEVLRLVDEPKTAYGVASQMDWNVQGKWLELPVCQKWFALSVTTGHLHYLFERSKVGKCLKGNVWVSYKRPQ